MGSRGSVARNGHQKDAEYTTASVLPHGGKVIEGIGRGLHSMPDYSHLPNSVYVIFKKGIFHAMRIYGEDHMPIIEIAYHPEPNLNHGDREHPIWHMHVYTEGNLDHNDAELITKEVETRYAEQLEDIEYDQWHS